jgi:deoxycytidylate deaminase
MAEEHFANMDMALATENQSQHPTYKVGAVLQGCDHTGQPFTVARPNFWPERLARALGTDTKLGNSSLTIHAEVAAILAAPCTDEATIYVTNFPCPNCAKMIAESRISRVFIDSHTHRNTPLGEKMYPYFENVSRRIFDKACIEVQEILYPRQDFKTLVPARPTKMRAIKHPVLQIPVATDSLNAGHFVALAEEKGLADSKNAHALCFARTEMGLPYILAAQTDYSIGMNERTADDIRAAQDKYSPLLYPVNRLLAAAARMGLRLVPEDLYCTHVPTSREWVNLIGAGFERVTIGNSTLCRDKDSLAALKTVRNKAIILVKD